MDNNEPERVGRMFPQMIIDQRWTLMPYFASLRSAEEAHQRQKVLADNKNLTRKSRKLFLIQMESLCTTRFQSMDINCTSCLTIKRKERNGMKGKIKMQMLCFQ